MLGIFSILAAEILFSFIILIWKGLRKAGTDPLSNLSLLSFSVPLFLVLWIFLRGRYVFNPSPEYFLYVALWLVPAFLYNIGNIYLVKYQSLVELNTYKLGFSTAIAILADIFFLRTAYSVTTTAAVVCFFVGGFLLTRNRSSSGFSLSKALTIILSLSILQVADYALYKKILLFQSMPLFGLVIAQCALALLFCLFGHRSLLRNIRNRVIKLRHIIGVTVLFVPFTLFEAFGLTQLPVAIVILATVLPLLVYSSYDLETAEVRISPQTVAALIGVIAGVVLLSV